MGRVAGNPLGKIRATLPAPRGLDNAVEVVDRRPSQHSARLGAVSHEEGRVAGTPRDDLSGDRVARDAPRRLDNLEDGEALRRSREACMWGQYVAWKRDGKDEGCARSTTHDGIA